MLRRGKKKQPTEIAVEDLPIAKVADKPEEASRELVIQNSIQQQVALLFPSEERDRLKLAVQHLVIDSDETYQGANVLLRTIQGFKKDIEDACKEKIETAFRLHRMLTKERNDGIQPLQTMRESVEKRMKGWLKYVEDNARQIEQQAKANAQSMAAQLELRYTRAMREGEITQADMIKQQIGMLQTAIPSAALARPRSEGTQIKRPWIGKVMDQKAALQGIIDGTIPADVIIWDQAALNRHASTLGGTTKWPGIEFEQDTKFAVEAL